MFVKFGWLDGRLDAVCGENTDKSIEKLTERLQAKNIICPIFIAALYIKLSKRKWKYNIKFFKSDSCVYILHFHHRFSCSRQA